MSLIAQAVAYTAQDWVLIITAIATAVGGVLAALGKLFADGRNVKEQITQALAQIQDLTKRLSEAETRIGVLTSENIALRISDGQKTIQIESLVRERDGLASRVVDLEDQVEGLERRRKPRAKEDQA